MCILALLGKDIGNHVDVQVSNQISFCNRTKTPVLGARLFFVREEGVPSGSFQLWSLFDDEFDDQ